MKNKNLSVSEKNSGNFLQPNLVSQSIHSLSATAKKLVALAVSKANFKGDNTAVKFTVTDFFQSFNLSDSGMCRRSITNALNECLSAKIIVDFPDAGWHGFNWFTEIHFEKGSFSGELCSHSISMTFSPSLSAMFKDLKKAYSTLHLLHIGKLQSRYAIRFYELALSWSGFAGKNGNEKNCWFFAYTVQELRKLFQIDDKLYPRNNTFREKIVDNPIIELNASDVGLQITIEYIRKGRNLVGFKFNCQYTDDVNLKLATPSTETEVSNLIIQEKFPDLYKKYYEIGINNETQQLGFFSQKPEIIAMRASDYACDRIRKEKKSELKNLT